MKEDLEIANLMAKSLRQNVFAIRYEDIVDDIIMTAERLYRYQDGYKVGFIKLEIWQLGVT